MKKISNKGMTLIELIVSVALISIIMLFMYKLISDVRNEKKENDKLANNIITISEIIVDLENRITKQDITKIQVTKYWQSYVIFYNYTMSNEKYTVSFEFKKKNNGIIISVSNSKEVNGSYQVQPYSVKKWTINDLMLDLNAVEIRRNPKNSENLKFINIIIPLKDSNGKIVSNIELPYYDTDFSYSFLDMS